MRIVFNCHNILCWKSSSDCMETWRELGSPCCLHCAHPWFED